MASPLGDGRIMGLGLGAMAAFFATALVGWALGVAAPGPRPLASLDVPTDTLKRALAPGITGRLPGIVRESSGVAVSQYDSQLLWTHNDGRDGRVFLVRLSGALAAVVRVVGVEIEDVEDIETGPCPPGWEDESCLYLANTGDNGRDRDTYSILVAPEPDPGADLGSSVRTDVTFTETRFRYPNGSRDAEALAVSPDGEVFVVTKGQEGSAELFRIPESSESGGVVDAVSIAVLPIDVENKEGRVTGAAFAASGDLLAVRSDESLHLFAPDDLTVALHRCPLPDAKRGEGVDFLVADLFVVTREGKPAPIEIVRCP